ncbi:MAG: DNA polymerase III, subunit gamma and tau [Candidatus Magasanikbacteria bacterium RIFOXYC2_FULL_42_28]|uniref:DNA polymerase III subunit gamma/tau n=1 Tax=Candidatus Magasanikbacteria bacterium RIFOXYC2_FULL_42_28 TaxID=1798704 RepID=A0A1F6NV05_9BACT|nr:MAG: DNA polymerase III, subunit gamma and tau [Candidatus Magasanikbacteria bacterium RIFOXYC2_FULL_42_28]
MATLYRKYRPQIFTDLVGQEHIVQTVMNEVAAGTPAHAFLFSGPRGVGKTTLARLLAKALNCEKRKLGKAEPCDECGSCQEISTGRNIDVIEMDAASHTGVENVRENIIDNAQFKPTKSPYKIFIIDEAHMLSTSSFNALLKTLEEPPAHALFILATTELNKLPDTIVSRCQRFNFKKIPAELIIAKLKKIASEEDVKVDKEVLELIAVKSGGCLRDAESLFGQILSLNLKKITLEATQAVLPSAQLEEAFAFVKNALAGATADMLATVAGLSNNGINPEIWAEDLLQILRLTLISQTGFQPTETALLTKSQISDLKYLAEHTTAPQLIMALDKTARRGQETRSAILPQLPLEILAVELVEIFHTTGTNNGATPPFQGGGEGVVKSPLNITPTQRLVVTKTTLPEPPKAVEVPFDVITSSLQGEAQRSPEESPSAITSPMTVNQATAIWNKMIETVGNSNMSLTFVLKMATIEKLDGRALILNIPYSFHKDKLDEPKSKKIILDALADAGGAELQPRYIIKTENNVADTSAQDLALQFGGEVVG